jgi:hypothetical protein
MANRVLLPPKRVGDTVLYSQFDFLSLFASASDTITAISVVTATVYSGIDGNPAGIIVNSSFSGSIVSVLVQHGVLGVIYELSVQVQLASSQQPILCGYLAIIPDLA